jgi:hypothetical protein
MRQEAELVVAYGGVFGSEVFLRTACADPVPWFR